MMVVTGVSKVVILIGWAEVSCMNRALSAPRLEALWDSQVGWTWSSECNSKSWDSHVISHVTVIQHAAEHLDVVCQLRFRQVFKIEQYAVWKWR